MQIIKKCGQLLTLVFSWSLCAISLGATFTLPPQPNTLVGEIQKGALAQGQTLEDFSRSYDIGYYEILEANPRTNPMTLRPGAKLVVPSQFILPDAPHEGVVINVAELRMYFYPLGGNQVMTQPIGIGRPGWETPVGMTAIKDKREHPSWRAPASVVEDMARRGIIIPAVTPPGPDNPLGDYAMRLTLPGYVIHGTNLPKGVGRRVSAGCIRLDPQDVAALFQQVEIGTPVFIVNQPFKVGWSDHRLYLEAHQPLVEQRKLYKGDYSSVVKEAISTAVKGHKVTLDWKAIAKAVKAQTGIPQIIGKEEG